MPLGITCPILFDSSPPAEFVDVPADYVSLYPMGAELLFGYGLALGGSIAAKLLHFCFLPFTAVLTFELCRRFVPRANPLLAAGVFSTVPTVMWEATTAYIDLLLTFQVTLALFVLLRFFRDGDRRWLALAIVFMGFALSLKHLALVPLLIFATALLWRNLARHASWRAFQQPVLFGICSLALASPWYIRSFLASGNPVFPELWSVFGSTPERWSDDAREGLARFLEHFGDGRSPAALALIPWNVTMHASRYGGCLGPVFLTVLPLLALVRWSGSLVLLAAFAVTYIAIWASPLASFQLRFLIPLCPALACLAAAGVRGGSDALARFIPRLWSLPSMIALILMVLNLPPFLNLHQRDRAGREGWLTSVMEEIPWEVVLGSEADDPYLARRIWSYGAWRFINVTLPNDALVLTWSGGDNLYSAKPRLWAHASQIIAAAWAKVEQQTQMLTALRSAGVTHVLIDRRTLDAPENRDRALIAPYNRERLYEKLYSDQHYVLYRLRWEAIVSSENVVPEPPGK